MSIVLPTILIRLAKTLREVALVDFLQFWIFEYSGFAGGDSSIGHAGRVRQRVDGARLRHRVCPLDYALIRATVQPQPEHTGGRLATLAGMLHLI